MTNICAVIFRNVLFLFSFLLLKPALAEPAVVIKWNLINKSLGITAKKTTLVIVLGEIRHQTGWEIFLEPNLNPAISIKTNPKPASEALGLLLGSLRYTLKTQSGRPSRLSIFRNSVSAATNPIAEAPAKPAKLSPSGHLSLARFARARLRRSSRTGMTYYLAFIVCSPYL